MNVVSVPSATSSHPQVVRFNAALAAFSADSQRQGRLILGLLHEYCALLAPVLIDHLSSDPPDGCDLLRLLSPINLVHIVSDVSLCSRSAAQDLAIRASEVDPDFACRLVDVLAHLDAGGPSASVRRSRIYELISALPPHPRAMPLLLRRLRTAEGRERSKIILLVCRAKPSVQYLKTYMLDPDHRVRANLLEALWGAQEPEILQYVRTAVNDPHPRVAANAIVALHLGGDPAATKLLQEMSWTPDPRFRLSAAWAMGRTGNPEFIPTLQSFAKCGDPDLRRGAVRALVALNAQRQAASVAGSRSRASCTR